MALFVNVCVILTASFAFGYLAFVILWPEKF